MSDNPPDGEAHRIPKPAPHWRIVRLRRMAWLLDRSIPIGGGWRVGLDPLLGLIPGAGDWLGALLSLYLIYEAARLGLPLSILIRMAGNIVVESFIGMIPIAGDLFDFVWQANIRNLRLVEQHYRPSLPSRSLRQVGLALGSFALALLGVIGFAVFGVIKLVLALFS